jgi:hypothetical protein
VVEIFISEWDNAAHMKNLWLIVGLLCCGTCVSAQTPNKAPASNPSTANHISGRYQLFFSPHARADQYLVDTETGRVWEKVSYTDLVGDPEIWLALPRIDGDIEFSEWLKTQQAKPKPDAH